MNVSWFLVVSALMFSIGAIGVLVRRNPLVVLLCLELMLNAGNLALLGFARANGNGDGQILAQRHARDRGLVVIFRQVFLGRREHGFRPVAAA